MVCVDGVEGNVSLLASVAGDAMRRAGVLARDESARDESRGSEWGWARAW